MKMPTSLKRLEELAEILLPDLCEDDFDDVHDWLLYILESLTARKLYMKKQQVKKSMYRKLLTEHLSADELAEVDRQAEDLVNKQIEAESTTPKGQGSTPNASIVEGTPIDLDKLVKDVGSMSEEDIRTEMLKMRYKQQQEEGEDAAEAK